MAYYSVSFGYSGPRTNFPDSNPDGSMSAAVRACIDADKICDGLREKLGLNLLHAYSFPDGSMYKFVKDERSSKELSELIGAALPDWMKVHDVTEVPWDTNPWKSGTPTLEAFFAEPA